LGAAGSAPGETFVAMAMAAPAQMQGSGGDVLRAAASRRDTRPGGRLTEIGHAERLLTFRGARCLDFTTRLRSAAHGFFASVRFTEPKQQGRQAVSSRSTQIVAGGAPR
jgi:hypothetical protein